jgi:hypothetical protein
MAVAEKPITRADIEAKLREIRGEVDTTTESARSYLMIVGGAGVVVIVGVAYFLGRRKGQKKSTVVEIRRV